MVKVKRILYISVVTLCTTACSLFPSFKDDQASSNTKGERIPVLWTVSETLPNREVRRIKISLPKESSNSNWLRSSGFISNYRKNLAFPDKVENTKKISAGKGTKHGYLNAIPVIADNKLFTISADSIVTAYNTDNIKKRIWETQLYPKRKKDRLSVTAGMTYYKKRLYITSGHNHVVSLDANNGEIIWKKKISSIARSAPIVKNGKIIVNTQGNTVYALDTKDGRIIWVHNGSKSNVSIFSVSAPVASKNSVVIPYSSGELYVLNINDGTEIWGGVFSGKSTNVTGDVADIIASPAIDGNTLFVISSDGILASTNLKEGNINWQRNIAGSQNLWIAGNFIYFISNNSELICIYKKNGGVRWVKKLETNIDRGIFGRDNIRTVWSGPVLANSLLYTVNSQGKLLSVSPYDGQIINTQKVLKDVYLPPIIADGKMYLYNNNAEVMQLY